MAFYVHQVKVHFTASLSPVSACTGEDHCNANEDIHRVQVDTN